jgi:1-acyl-sn-glycerol-3-phosphate acyltransferase
MIRAVIIALFLTLCTVLLGLPLLLYTVVTRSTGPLYWTGTRSLLVVGWIAGMRVRTEGSENIPSGVCLFVSNHTSNMDIPALLYAIPRRIAFVAKQSLFRIPVVGTAIRLANFVPVDRSRRDAVLAVVKQVVEFIRAGTSFLVFPEGTRSRDGRLQPFKHSAFLIAIQSGVPVVPVACAGAHRVMPRHSLRIHPGDVLIRFGRPIDVSECGTGDRSEVARRAFEAVAAMLPQEQRPRASLVRD